MSPIGFIQGIHVRIQTSSKRGQHGRAMCPLLVHVAVAVRTDHVHGNLGCLAGGFLLKHPSVRRVECGLRPLTDTRTLPLTCEDPYNPDLTSPSHTSSAHFPCTLPLHTSPSHSLVTTPLSLQACSHTFLLSRQFPFLQIPHAHAQDIVLVPYWHRS